MRQPRALLTLLEAAVMGLALAACGRAPLRDPAANGPLTVDGRWIRDSTGRVVILRGLNYSALEFGNYIGQPHGPTAANFDQIAAWGANVVRLPISWASLEPAPGELHEEILDQEVDPIVGWAAAHGIRIILVMHQYGWSSCVGGNGVPAWTCDNGGYGTGAAAYLAASCDFWKGRLAPDGRTLQAHLADVWAMVAAHYAGDSRVVGFDLFNEPPNIGCMAPAAFAKDTLYPMYNAIGAAIRQTGADQLLVIEPDLLRSSGVGFPAGHLDDPNSIYAPHLYTEELLSLPGMTYSGNTRVVAADYALAQKEAQSLGIPLWVGELGGDTGSATLAATEQFITDSQAQLDAALVGGAVWAYFPSDDTFSVVDATGAPKDRLASILSRPYARAIAGEPVAMAYDPASARFSLSWTADDATAKLATQIVLPALARSKGAPAVVGSSGLRWRFSAAESLLRVWAPKAGSYHVQVTLH